MILMWSCPGNMTKYYRGLRDILSDPRVICLSDLGNMLAYYLDMTTLLYKYYVSRLSIFFKSTSTSLFTGSTFSLKFEQFS